jgi:L-ascorbate metabolism protein UlaG (beta-lactamase superfamily)
MTTTLRFLGASGYEVVGPQCRILFDPFLRGNPWAPTSPEDVETPDVICVSHAAWDHLGDTAEIAIRTGCPVVTSSDVAVLLRESGVPQSQLRATIWGVCYAFGSVAVRPVECHHWSSSQLGNGQILTGVPLSFIVEAEPGVRVYHFGDSALFGDMKNIGALYRPTVGLLGCAQTDGLPDDPGAGILLTGEMTPDEAAIAADWLGLTYAVATHYMHAGAEAQEFLRRVPVRDSTGKRRAFAPEIGDTLSIEPIAEQLPHLIWGETSEEWNPDYRPAMAAPSDRED